MNYSIDWDGPGERDDEDDGDYEVEVWDWEGNIVRKLWHATQAEADELMAQYEDEPGYNVVVHER